MPDPTRIRATVRDGVVDVRVLMAHDMETGLRKDAAGKLIAPWHITEVTVSLNGRPALLAHWGPAISRNPFLQVRLRAAKAGDRVTVAWVDNRGERRSDEALVG